MFQTLYTTLLLAILLGLNACNSKPAANNYFPLNEGLHWEYQFQLITTSKKQESGIYTVENIGTTEIENNQVTVRRTNDGRDYYLQNKSDGIYRFASRTLFEIEPSIDKPPRMVIPLPYLKDSDKGWSSPTTSYIIHRTGPSTIASANPIKDFDMSYRVTAKDETVIVPAGKFENCLLIEGDATVTMFVDPLTGYQDIPIKTREWYAAGVGMVKMERIEPLETRLFKGGSYVFELSKFTY